MELSGEVVISKLWIRPGNSEGNPLHVSFSREPETHNVILQTIGLETSYDWHRDKQVYVHPIYFPSMSFSCFTFHLLYLGSYR